MFKALETTQFMTILKENAIPVILKDRNTYNDVYQVVEEYCKENHNLIISDIQKLLNKEDKLAFKVYEIYCENPYKHAITLTNQIYQKIGKWTQLTTVITHQEFEIYYDGRNVVKIYNLVKGKDIKLIDLVNPVLIYDINYISPEIELIDVYKRLYLPDKCNEWKALLDIESYLFDLVKIRNESAGEIKLGGADIENEPPIRRDLSELENLKKIILEEYVYDLLNATENKTNNQILLLGHWALNLIEYVSESSTGELKSHVEKLQIISPNVENDIKNIQLILQKHTDLVITHREHILHLPKDFRVKRYTLYVSSHSLKEVPFMDIFNSTEFELVPYNVVKVGNKQVKIANSYVLLRFIMIDLWMLKVIDKMGKIHKKPLAAKLKALYELIYKIKNPRSDVLKRVFGVDYIGTNIDFAAAKKMERLKYKVFPYIPAIAEKYGKFRVIN